MSSTSTSIKSDKKRTSTSTKVTGDVNIGKREQSSSAAAFAAGRESASTESSASPPLTPSPSTPGTSEDSVLRTPSSPTPTAGVAGLSSVSSGPHIVSPTTIETFDSDGQYTELETHLRQYSRDVYAYTLTLYNAQRIDAAHRGRAATLTLNLKRTVSDIAIPMKAMAVGDARGTRV